jgi:hypothetical protein
MCDEDFYAELRILAAETIGELARARYGKAESVPSIQWCGHTREDERTSRHSLSSDLPARTRRHFA